MKRLIINRNIVPGPFGGGNAFLSALKHHAEDYGLMPILPSEIRSAGGFIDASNDIFLAMDPRPGDQEFEFGADELAKWAAAGCKVVHRVNDIDSKRDVPIGMDQMLRRLSEASSLSIFVSKWLAHAHNEMGWSCTNQAVIYNGVDLDLFRPRGAKINNGKVNIVVHHWSDNIAKGAELHSFLDYFAGENADDYSFTYIGRPNFQAKHANVIEPLAGEDLAIELSRYDVCINGSKNDPASNSIIEAMACGLPVYAPRSGGGSIELVGADHIWDNLHDVYGLLISKAFMPNSSGVALRPWTECIKEFCEAICAI